MTNDYYDYFDTPLVYSALFIQTLLWSSLDLSLTFSCPYKEVECIDIKPLQYQGNIKDFENKHNKG